MVEKSVVVAQTLEARPTALFVQLAGKYESNIKIKIDNKFSNAKSIMGVISLGITKGNIAVISAEGIDENDAVTALTDFLTQ